MTIGRRLGESRQAQPKSCLPCRFLHLLSFAERDPRWARMRGLLHGRDLAAVLVAGFRAREMLAESRQ